MTENLKVTFFSLIISFTVMFPISAFTAIKLIKNKPSVEHLKNKKTNFEFIIPKKQDITLLIAIADNFSNPADIYILTKISAHDNTIVISRFPENIKSIINGTRESIKNLYKIGGIDYAKQAIENIMNIEIDRTLKLDKNAIEGICDSLEGVKIPYKDSNRAENYKIIDGKTFYKELIKSPIKNILKLKNCFDENTNLSNFFINLANLGETDISIYDFENRKKGFEILIEKNSTIIYETDKKITEIFKKNIENDK